MTFEKILQNNGYFQDGPYVRDGEIVVGRFGYRSFTTNDIKLFRLLHRQSSADRGLIVFENKDYRDVGQRTKR